MAAQLGTRLGMPAHASGGPAARRARRGAAGPRRGGPAARRGRTRGPAGPAAGTNVSFRRSPVGLSERAALRTRLRAPGLAVPGACAGARQCARVGRRVRRARCGGRGAVAEAAVRRRRCGGRGSGRDAGGSRRRRHGGGGGGGGWCRDRRDRRGRDAEAPRDTSAIRALPSRPPRFKRGARRLRAPRTGRLFLLAGLLLLRRRPLDERHEPARGAVAGV